MLKRFHSYSRQPILNLLRRLKHTNSQTTNELSSRASLGRDSKIPSVYNLPALSKSLQGLTSVKYATAESNRYETHVTELDNGLRIASEKLFGDFCTVGVIISAGPRFEGNYVSGISHHLEKLAFMSTKKYTSREQVVDLLQEMHAICDCQTARDVIIYASSCRTSGLERIVELLSETVFHPQFLPHEMKGAENAIVAEIDDLKNRRYDPAPIIADMIHAAGYGKKTLGLPKYTPLENVGKIDESLIRSYMKEFYRPERMVLAGVGVDHAQLVDLGKKYFSVPKSDAKKQNDEKAIWTGGVVLEERDLSHLSFGADPLPEVAHVALGFEAPSHTEEHDFVSACILSQLLGGGGSFSAGGPGKGLYSRFYLNVLNSYEFIKTAISLNQAYTDSGCLYFHFAGEPSSVPGLVDIAKDEIGRLVNELPGKTELQRAKRQLQSMLLMNLEQRPVVFEDVARQVLSTGKRQMADHYFNRIEQIQADDVHKVARKIFSTPLALVGLGRGVQQMRPHSQISAAIQQQFTRARWRILN